jgi:hypothetical protein
MRRGTFFRPFIQIRLISARTWIFQRNEPQKPWMMLALSDAEVTNVNHV